MKLDDFKDDLSSGDLLEGLEVGQTPEQIIALATGNHETGSDGDASTVPGVAPEPEATIDPSLPVLNTESDIVEAEQEVVESLAGIESAFRDTQRANRDLDYLRQLESGLEAALERGGMSSGEASAVLGGLDRVMEDHDLTLETTQPGVESFQGAMGRISATEAGLESVREGINKLKDKVKTKTANLIRGVREQFNLMRTVSGKSVKTLGRHRTRIEALESLQERELDSEAVVLGVAFRADKLDVADVLKGIASSERILTLLGGHYGKLGDAFKSTMGKDLDATAAIVKKSTQLPSSIFAQSGSEGQFELRNAFPGGRQVIVKVKDVEVTGLKTLHSIGTGFRSENVVNKRKVDGKFQSLTKEQALALIDAAVKVDRVIADLQKIVGESTDRHFRASEFFGSEEKDLVAIRGAAYNAYDALLSNHPLLRCLRAVTTQVTSIVRLIRTVV